MGITKKIKPQSNKLTPKKAYILGFLFGEASIYRNNQFSVTQKNREMLVILSKFIGDVYGKRFKPNIPSKPNHKGNLYQTYICGKELVADLKKFVKGFGYEKWGLNENGFKDCWNSNSISAYFIRGIADGEGKKPRQRKRYVEKETVIGNTNLNGLWQIILLLEKHWEMIPVIFKVKNKKYYHLRISGEDFIKFAGGTKKAPPIGFYHPERKKMMIEAIKQETKLKQYPPEIFLEAWKLRIDSGFGYIRIARKLGIKESAVGFWIYLGHRPFIIQKMAKRIVEKVDGKNQITPLFLETLFDLINPIAKKMNGRLDNNIQFLLDRIIGIPIKTKYWAKKGKYSEEILRNATDLSKHLSNKGYSKLRIAKNIQLKFGINANTFRRHFI